MTRQIEDARALADRLGLDVRGEFVDNDISASTFSTKTRPQFDTMIARAEAGEFGYLLAYSNSRLTRRPLEFERLIQLHEKHGVKIRTVVSGDQDLSTADGRAVARTIAAWDAAEAERTRERVVRKLKQRADQGLPHGRAYGWLPGGEVNEEQAAIIREAAERALADESLRAISRSFNEREVPPPGKSAKSWTPGHVRVLLLRERNAGNLVHQGQVVGKGKWEPILDDRTFARLKALLKDPARRTNSSRGSERRHLLSGIAVCGECGQAVKVHKESYMCPGLHVRRRVAAVDDLVRTAVLERLGTADTMRQLLAGDPTAYREAEERIEGIDAQLTEAADLFAKRKINAAQLGVISESLTAEREQAEKDLRAAEGGGDELASVWSGYEALYTAWTRWDLATLDQQRMLVQRLMTVVIDRVGGGRHRNLGVRVEQPVA